MTKSPLVALAMSIGSWLVLPVVLAVGALLVAGRAERDRAAAAESSRVITTARMIAWLNLIVGGAVLAFVGGFVAAVLMGR